MDHGPGGRGPRPVPLRLCPAARDAAESVALEIAARYLKPDAAIHELTFPMSADADVLRRSWQEAAGRVHRTLAAGEDCCFLTLGDTLLYSTYIYLVRELQAIDPAAKIVTVPGVAAFSAAAALAGFPIGEGKQIVTIVPASDDLDPVSPRPGRRRDGRADEDRPPAPAGVGRVGVAAG